MKVGANQPNMIGIDVMHTLGIDLLLSEMKFSVNTMKPPPISFNQRINFSQLMHEFTITPDQLKPITQLPPLQKVVQKMYATDSSHLAVNLGSLGFLFFPALHHKWGC